MQRFKRHPWFSFLTLLVFLALIGLCAWQLQRLSWKQEMIARIDDAARSPATIIDNTRAPDVRILSKMPEFTRVQVTGTFLPEPVFELLGRYYQGNTGVHLIQPFLMQGGNVILIDRGWVPKDYKKDPRVKLAPERKRVTLTGMIRGNEEPRFASVLPKNDPEKSFWLWRDIPAMQRVIAAKNDSLNILPVFIQRTREMGENDFPIAQDSQVELRNDHLQYAITWGALAVITVVMYLFYTNPKKRTKPAAKTASKAKAKPKAKKRKR